MLVTEKPELMGLDYISIPERLRQLDLEKVEKLAESMAKIGQIVPVNVRIIGDGEDVILVAGRHRIEAAKRLGWEKIRVAIIETDAESDDDYRLWEIAENLHRADLTPLERAEHVAEWVRLAEKGGQVVHPVAGGQQPNDAGISKAARELPVHGTTPGAKRKNVERSVKVDSIAPEAKQAARETGLDHNQSALLKVASAPKEEQAETVRKIAAEKAAPKPKPAPQAKDQADELADMLLEHLPLMIMPAFLSLYEATEARFVTKTIRRKLKERRAA